MHRVRDILTGALAMALVFALASPAGAALAGKTIQKTIDRFKELGVQQIGLSHCTGPKATKMFQEQMPGQTFLNNTGSVYTVD